jgi:uncharacterized protein YwqG
MSWLKKILNTLSPEKQPTITYYAEPTAVLKKTYQLSNIDELQMLFKEFELDKYFDELKPHIKTKINLTTKPLNESDFAIGQSKIGGLPDLLDEDDWPKTEKGKPMSFIGQLNLSMVARYDDSDLLPNFGLLSFFYCAEQSAWGFDPNDKQRFKVLYTAHIADLQKIKSPLSWFDNANYKPNEIKFANVLSLPGWETEIAGNLFIDDNDFDRYEKISGISENQMFGYPNCVQDSMELECQLVTNGLYCGNPSGYEDPRRKELEDGVKDWVLLLQIGSEEEKTGMTWSNKGNLYYWMRKQDLKNLDFDKAWLILQGH